MTVTRDVVSDLWPLYASGEASADTRALVDAFLASDPAFGQVLRDSSKVSLNIEGAPALPPGHDLVALDMTRRKLWGPAWLLQLAILFSAFAFARIVSDTSFDVSPRQFIVTAAIAFGFWTAFIVVLWRNRARILIVRPKASPSAKP